MIREVEETKFVEQFYDLMAEVECGSHFDFGNPRHDEWLRRRISRHYYRGVKFFGYYLEDDKPVGFAGLLAEEKLEGVACFGQMTELLDIGIFPEYRGKGYGKELLKYAEDYSREFGAYCMYMATYARSRETIAFYGSHGFVPVATLPDVHGPGDEGTVHMRKIIRR